MINHLFDILKIVFYTALAAYILSRFPNLTFEGALVICASFYLIISGWVYRGLGKNHSALKFVNKQSMQKTFSEIDPGLSKKSFHIAGIKLVISALILFALSVLVFYYS